MGGEYEDDCEGHCGMDVHGNLVPNMAVVPSTSNANVPASYFSLKNKPSNVDPEQMEEICLR